MVRELAAHKVGVVNEAICILALDPPSGCHGVSADYRLTIPHRSAPFHQLNFHVGDPAYGINGITIEALLAIAIDRLQGFQATPFHCRENAIALTHLETALLWLQARTRERQARGVEGAQTP